MKTKSYTKDQVHYAFNIQTRKWKFEVGNFSFLTSCPGGAETAHKVAGFVSGSAKRSAGSMANLDGMARSNISRLVG